MSLLLVVPLLFILLQLLRTVVSLIFLRTRLCCCCSRSRSFSLFFPFYIKEKVREKLNVNKNYYTCSLYKHNLINDTKVRRRGTWGWGLHVGL